MWCPSRCSDAVHMHQTAIQYSGQAAVRYHAETKADLIAHEEEKLVTELIDRAELTEPNGWNILDIGCAGGVHLHFLAKKFPTIRSLVGVDHSSDLIAIAKQEVTDHRASFDVADMHNLPYADAAFDLVFSRNTFHYASAIMQTLQEVRRVLKPGGRCYFQDVHPLYALFWKSNKDYAVQENVCFPIQGGSAVVRHPTHTLQEYFDAIVTLHFQLVSYREYFGRRSRVGQFRIPVVHGFLIAKEQ